MSNTLEYNATYYASRREILSERGRNRQRAISKKISDLKLSMGCKRCGYAKSARALQFHHRDDTKEHDVSRMVGQGRLLSSIMIEIKKCDLLCANCHAEEHDKDC